MTTAQAELLRERVFAEFKVTLTHPDGLHVVFPLPTSAQVAHYYQHDELALVAEWLQSRELALQRMASQPLDYGFEPPTWKEADLELALPEIFVLAAFGANRMGKSWWAAKRLCEAARAYPGGLILIGAETEKSSRETAQKAVWHYFEKWLAPFNDDSKRSKVHKVNYSIAGGFTEGTLVLPNSTMIAFTTYKTEAKTWEGAEFGARVTTLARRKDGSVIENIGWWADEACPMEWLELFSRRGRYRGAKGAWTYTPIHGLTPAMKEFLGTPQIVSDLPAKYLPEARIPGCRPGHMPRTAVPAYKGGRVIWFHIGDNPFGGYNQTVVEVNAGRSMEMRERFLYGYARDAVARAFPKFGPAHVVGVEDLPAQGRNFRIVDPADARPFFVIWVRVHDGALWVYRDWPDKARFGEWAVATERETSADSRKGWDGDRGPAQGNFGLGVEGYKREWFKAERITQDSAEERDPFRRRIQEALKPDEVVHEPIHGSLIDPRAGPRKDVTDKGGTCLVWRFAVEHRPAESEVLPAIHFQMAPGLEVDKGIATINTLLEYNEEAALDAVTNAPKLYVAANCEQVLWAMQNYTARSGDEGACKDPVDCVRMAATSRLVTVAITPGMERSGAGW